MTDADFEKPIIAIANSFTQFVPGHVHLHDVGQRVKKVIDAAGGWGVEFNTIAVDDGIAMGHGGMLYSLPSRELIADSVEYMVNAHCADALVCISNCDKITPGMLMAAMRLNIPTIFVSGGPMEAGKIVGTHDRDGKPLIRKLDLIDSMIAASDAKVSDAELGEIERSPARPAAPAPGMFTANSMNCLTEALGLALPGNGTLLATHARALGAVRGGRQAHRRAGQAALRRRRRARCSRAASPPSRRSRTPWRSTSPWAARPTPCCTSWPSPTRRASTSRWRDIDRLSRKVPNICKVAPSSHYHVEDVHRAGGIFTHPGRARPRRAHPPRRAAPCTPRPWATPSTRTTSAARRATAAAKQRALAAPGGVPTKVAFSQDKYFADADDDAREGLHPRRRRTPTARTAAWPCSTATSPRTAAS